MDKKPRIVLCIEQKDLQLLDQLAAEIKHTARRGRAGYRPAVIEKMLDILQESGVTPKEFAWEKYRLSKVK